MSTKGCHLLLVVQHCEIFTHRSNVQSHIVYFVSLRCPKLSIISTLSFHQAICCLWLVIVLKLLRCITYIGLYIHITGSSESEIRRCTAVTWNCISTSPVGQNLWRSSITLSSKLWVYRTFILPVFLYRSETWLSLLQMLSYTPAASTQGQTTSEITLTCQVQITLQFSLAYIGCTD